MFKCLGRRAIENEETRVAWIEANVSYLELRWNWKSSHVYRQTSLACLYQLVEAESLSQVILGCVNLTLLLGLGGCLLEQLLFLQKTC